MEGFTRVATTSDVPPGTTFRLELSDKAICLVNTEGALYALRDNCSHKDFPLSEGEVLGHALTCAWHGARFDVRDGRALSLPAIRPVETFEVEVRNDEIWLRLENA